MKQQHLSRVMRMSWQIQRRRNTTRSKSLTAAWSIFLNEDISVYYLTKKHSHQHYENKVSPQSLTLFGK